MAKRQHSSRPRNRHMQHVHTLSHPLALHILSQVRDRTTTHARFRELISQLGTMLAYEATRDLTLVRYELQTPLEKTSGHKLTAPLTLVPILRAGLGLTQGILRLIPDAHLGHIGMFRDEEQLRPVTYYDKLPYRIQTGPVLLIDPMLATGGSALAATQLLKNHGAKDIRLLCVLASPEGIKHYRRMFSDIPIYTVAIDRELDDRGFILPGLGDAGDRLFGTAED